MMRDAEINRESRRPGAPSLPKDIRMSMAKVEDRAAATTPGKRSRPFWNEGPVVKFCVGFCVFVLAEVIVYVTMHWIFSFI